MEGKHRKVLSLIAAMSVTLFLIFGLVTGFAFAYPSDSEKDTKNEPKPLPPLMCYQCTSDPNPSLHALIPTLPYHPKCGSARLPEDYLTKCDNVTQMKDVVTIYDFVGIHERNNLLSDTKRKEMECGKFSFTKNSVIRRGCSFTSPARAWITYKDIVYQGKDKISANFCWSPRCNKGTTPWLGGAVLLLSLGASLARFAN